MLELKQLSLEELMNVEVTSVSKKEEKSFEAAAAIYVITAEDLRRSGATSIPELLHNVPALDVARLNSNMWNIWFYTKYSNRLVPYHPLVERSARIGTLYLKSDLQGMQAHFRFYVWIVGLVLVTSVAGAFGLAMGGASIS
jgi:hypothetical protein